MNGKPANTLSVRELQSWDIEYVLGYWFNAGKDFLKAMGVDPGKMPGKESYRKTLQDQLKLPYDQKTSYHLIWTMDDQPVGHCNTNPIFFADNAFMHLHLWKSQLRGKGVGTEFVSLSLPFFFENLKLKSLFSEPYALNAAPHITLERAGFKLEKEYITVPGFINFEQPVKQWHLTAARFKALRNRID